MAQSYRVYTIIAMTADGEILESIEMDVDSTLDEVASEWFSMAKSHIERVEIQCEIRRI